jgi:hypothetical protein
MSKNRRQNRTGRSTSTFSRQAQKHLAPETPFVGISLEMLESRAFRSLSKNAFLLMFRVCVEHLHHAGQENGSLYVSYRDFERYGIRSGSIRAAISELEEAGFLKVVEVGLRIASGSTAPSKYELTWLGKPLSFPTNEWKKL